MADAVAATLETGGTLVVEAGTGVGKTFAYLVPALLSGQRLLLSTATKTLQDQLHGRDIPRLLTALGLPVRVALLKGRSSTCAPSGWPAPGTTCAPCIRWRSKIWPTLRRGLWRLVPAIWPN